MKEKGYYLNIGGRAIKVSKEVYQEYYKGERKERYFMKDLKMEHISIDLETNEEKTVPSREDSYERLLELNRQFEELGKSVEEQAMQTMMLGQAIQALMAQEREIIEELYVLEKTERQVSEALHIAKTTLHRRHKLEAGDYLQKIFPFLGLRFIAVNDQYDSAHEVFSEKDLIMEFKNLANEYCSRDISQKILNEEGIPSPSKYVEEHGKKKSQEKGAVLWQGQAVSRISYNQVYAGDLV